MNIQDGLEKPLLDKSYSLGAGRKDPIRRMRRSVSVKKSEEDFQSLSRASSFEKSPPSPCITSKNIKVKRLENLSSLRNIHRCLRKILPCDDKKIILKDPSNIEVIPHIPDGLTQEMDVAVVNYIYKKILRAMTLQVFYFFDDKGYPVILKDVDKLVEKKYGDIQNTFTKEIKQELDSYYEEKPHFLFGKGIESESEYLGVISHLELPDNIEKEDLKENEKICLHLFQKLYPLRNAENKVNGEIPMMAPITFLCSYKKFVSTEELFKNALTVLRFKDESMPHLQKLRVLNFMRVYFECEIYKDEKISLQTKEYIKRILEIASKSKNQEFIDLTHEIQFILEYKKPDYLIAESREVSKRIFSVDEMLTQEPAKIVNYAEFIHQLTDDIKSLSTQSVLNVKQSDLFQEKKSNDSDIFYNDFMNYIVKHFIQHFKKELNHSHERVVMQNKVHAFFEIFTDVAYELANKRDYLSSCAIYNIFNMPEFNQLLIFYSKENKHAFAKGKRNSSLRPSTTDQKMKELNDLFSTHGNFEKLQKKMKYCLDFNLYFVPLLAPLKNKILHKLEMINLSFEESEELKINTMKLQMIADEMWEINEMLLSIKNTYRNQKNHLNTNIGYLIISTATEKYNPDSLGEIVKKLKGL